MAAVLRSLMCSNALECRHFEWGMYCQQGKSNHRDTVQLRSSMTAHHSRIQVYKASERTSQQWDTYCRRGRERELTLALDRSCLEGTDFAWAMC